MKYNLDKLNELSGGDKEFNKTVIETFIQETPDDFSNLKKAVEAETFPLIYQHAHKIKPNADLLGINELREQMLSIEGHARGDMDIEAIKRLLEEAAKELDAAYAEFNAYLK